MSRKSGAREAQTTGQMTQISGKEDMRWLRDVHLPRLSIKKFKSAVIYGREDCPARVDVRRSSDPSIFSDKVVYVRADRGSCRLKRKR